jgi:hypothetical protein
VIRTAISHRLMRSASGIRMRDIALTAVFVVAVALLCAPQAEALTTTDQQRVVNYADLYSCNGTHCRNHAYLEVHGSDCTNFASQAIYQVSWARGASAISDWRPYTSTWKFVETFMSNRTLRSHYTFLMADVTKPYNPAAPGDLIAYDWGRGHGWSHMAIEAGWGNRSVDYSPDGRGDYVDQHDTDRYHAPWNYGYLHPDGSINRTKMRAVILHWS